MDQPWRVERKLLELAVFLIDILDLNALAGVLEEVDRRGDSLDSSLLIPVTLSELHIGLVVGHLEHSILFSKQV
jgi:hypothetical protein